MKIQAKTVSGSLVKLEDLVVGESILFLMGWTQFGHMSRVEKQGMGAIISFKQLKQISNSVTLHDRFTYEY